MNHEPPTASPDTVVMEALQIMVATGKRHLPAVSDGRLVGIDGISDLMDAVVHNFRLGRRHRSGRCCLNGRPPAK
jgi:CBS domain-containing protein